MKRFLIHLLVLSIFASGAAWAWDDHDEAITGHSVAAENYAKIAFDPDPVTDLAGEIEEHDHYCCHGNVHLAGLFSCFSILPNDWAHGAGGAVSSPLRGQSIFPPYKPPRV